MAELFAVDVRTVSEHLKNVFASGELNEPAVVRKFRNTAGKVSAEMAREHAESEFERFRIVQDRLFESDFDKVVRQIKGGHRPSPARQAGANKPAKAKKTE